MDYKEKELLLKEGEFRVAEGYEAEVKDGVITIRKTESEDEKIIKSVTRLVKSFHDINFPAPEGFSRKNLLDWLEKQGEKDEEILILKDQIESLHAAIKAIKETHRIELEKQGEQKSVEEKVWSIYNAKDGDVLTNDFHIIFIFKNIKEDAVISYCSIIDRTSDTIVHSFDEMKVGHISIVNFYPATKEQRDLLFQKMREAGYEWDAEKKELRKIKQNPNWDEEDEERRLDANVAFDNYFDEEYADALRDWLKSLKERYTWKPSDEQMEVLKILVSTSKGFDHSKILESLYNDLMKLREE